MGEHANTTSQITTIHTPTPNTPRTYIAIDLKSFYASVECQMRGLDPLTTNLVVADASRTEKTICLAVSPSLKALGIPGRARLFEVVQKVKEANAERLSSAIAKRAVTRQEGRYAFRDVSSDAALLSRDLSLGIGYITATPRMKLYQETSAKIYAIYLKYIAPEDIHVYSIDEVFMDVSAYLSTYHMTAHELAMTMIREVLAATGITATAGIAPNLYLAKVAMDIGAKHVKADKDGVRIAELDELSYRQKLWDHTPITDFWRVGRGYAKKLADVGLYTMGDIARCSLGKDTDFHNEDLLYKLFGINAELLIDHAWGYEPTDIAAIKAYKPEMNSLTSGQVLGCPYDAEKARLIVREMTELMALDLVAKDLVTDQLVLTLGYDQSSDVTGYTGEMTKDWYGKTVPKHAHGTAHLDHPTSSARQMTSAMMDLYDRIIEPAFLVRRVNVTAAHVQSAKEVAENRYEQLSLFSDTEAEEKQKRDEARENKMQKAILDLQKKFGKNAVLKGMNLQEGAKTIERNSQIGGHKA